MFQRFTKTILTIAFLLMVIVKVNAQSEGLKKAEKLYKAGDYYSAIAYYNDYISGKSPNKNINSFTGYLSKPTAKKTEVMENPKTMAAFHMAESYRKINDYGNAESWYDSAAGMKGAEKYPSIGYWMAVCLRANGKTPAARTAFQYYISNHDDKDPYYHAAKKELADIDFAAKETAKKVRRKIIFGKMKDPINGQASNYAPFVMNNNLYFSSTREDTTLASSKITPYQHHIFSASLSGGNPAKVSFQQDKNIQQGAAAFSADGKTVFLTQWTMVNGESIGAIYMSTKTDSNWTAAVKMDSTINKTGYSSQQPFISTDGKYLFFASNRPGGLGKYDIWVAELKANYEPISVTNLDNTVNTREDEKSPYFNTTNQTLVFSSNGRAGMGGFDLYSSKKSGGMFAEAVNLGVPANSAKDDIYFFSKDNVTDMLRDAYISSDRVSTCCLELFSIQRMPAPINHITGTVRNETTKVAIPNANLEWKTGAGQKTIMANDRGEYEIVVPDTAIYDVTVYNPKYYDSTERLKHIFETMDDSVYHADFYLRPVPEVVKDYMVYFDFDSSCLTATADNILDSVVMLLKSNASWKMSLEGYTDGKGSKEYNLVLSKNRAESCLKYLAEHDIDSTRLVPTYYGKSNPVAPNETKDGKDNPEGRKLNRRVKLSVQKDK